MGAAVCARDVVTYGQGHTGPWHRRQPGPDFIIRSHRGHAHNFFPADILNCPRKAQLLLIMLNMSPSMQVGQLLVTE